MINKTEAQWQAESDARTLLEAECIKQDSKRKRMAIQQVAKIEKEAESTLKNAKNVKSKPVAKKTVSKRKK